MSDDDNQFSGACSGCLSIIILIFIFWILFVGISTPWGKFNVDIFPPEIKNVSK